MSPSSLQTIAAANLRSPDALHCLDTMTMHPPINLQMLLTSKLKEMVIAMLWQPDTPKNTELLNFITDPNTQDIVIAVLPLADILLKRDPEVGLCGPFAYTNTDIIFSYDWSLTS